MGLSCGEMDVDLNRWYEGDEGAAWACKVRKV